MLLVEALGGGQRAAGGEAEARVGLALERREVVEERRALLLGRLLELGDLAGLVAHGGDDRVGLLGGLQPRLGAGVEAALVAAAGLPSDGSKVASTSQYGSGLKARISSSRRARIASVGVCTRPSETAPSNEERRRIVAARVAFMPTIQSASERERAASSSRPNSDAGRSALNASWIAAVVIDDSHSRWTGFFAPAFSYVQAKISSPSRPASQALTTSSTSSRLSSLRDDVICFFERSSRTTSLNSSGTIGRSAIRHFLYLASYSSGSASCTRCPTAHVTTCVGLQVALVLGERARQDAGQVAARRTASRR